LKQGEKIPWIYAKGNGINPKIFGKVGKKRKRAVRVCRDPPESRIVVFLFYPGWTICRLSCSG
jgi:hypothetical protein